MTIARGRGLETMARLGFATEGIVYVLVGGLAVLLATGQGGRATGSTGAIQTLGALPFGGVLLYAAAIGLAAYGLWRLFEAAMNPLGVSGAKGAASRLGFLVGGLVHLGLAVVAFKLARGAGAPAGDPTRPWIVRVMHEPGGRVLIALIGAVLVGHALYQLVCAVRGQLPRELEPIGPGGQRATWLVNLGRAGLAARGVVFGLIGQRLVAAAWHARAAESRDVGGTLRDLGTQAYGDLLLGVVAAGLAAYGIFMLTCARYGRIAGA